MKLIRIVILIALLTAACQPDATSQELPTLAVLPSLTPSSEPDAPTAEPTIAPPTNTVIVPSATVTILRPTDVPQPTVTPRRTATIDPTQAAAVALTAAVDQAPRIITLTPNPAGNEGPPQVLADVVITESQFQSQVNAAIADISSIEQAFVDFQPDGIYVDLTALGGQAYIAGRVQLDLELAGGFVAITVGEIETNAAEVPEGYLLVVNGEFFAMMIDVLDTILNERVGEENDLENLILTDAALEVFLLIPEQ